MGFSKAARIGDFVARRAQVAAQKSLPTDPVGELKSMPPALSARILAGSGGNKGLSKLAQSLSSAYDEASTVNIERVR